VDSESAQNALRAAILWIGPDADAAEKKRPFDAYAFLESAGLAKREFRRLGFILYDTTGLAINPSLLTIVVHE